MKRIVLSMLMAAAFVGSGSLAAHAERTANLKQHEYQAIQQGLREAGYYRAWPVDGKWGPVSIRALSSYQSDKGLHVTGKPNDETLKKLGVVLNRRTQNVTTNSK